MKHRHTFFVPSSVDPPPEAFRIVPGNKNDPSVLSIKHLQAAREWKITIDAEDVDIQVKPMIAIADEAESQRYQAFRIDYTICQRYCNASPRAAAAWVCAGSSCILEWYEVLYSFEHLLIGIEK
jgi:hypothetical protein